MTAPGSDARRSGDRVGLRRPSLLRQGRELLLGWDVTRLALSAPALARLPRGTGDPVILIPGVGGDDASMLPLRTALSSLGHDARPAGLGRIDADVEARYLQVLAVAQRVAGETDRPVSLIGWSIGGVLAREAARDDPDVVSQVITLATPVIGGPSYTAIARFYRESRLAEIRALIEERNQVPITVPITAIWSSNDGVVVPAACMDHLSSTVEHVEVTSTHIGITLDPTVWSIIARRLAA